MWMRIPRLVSQGNAEASRDAVANILKRILRVDQLRASWNSLLVWLRDVQAWSLAADMSEFQVPRPFHCTKLNPGLRFVLHGKRRLT